MDSTTSDDAHLKICNNLHPTLNDDQKKFVDNYWYAFISNNSDERLFVLDGEASTRITHHYNYLFHLNKSKNIRIIAFAFTSIEAILLFDGRTLHFAFKLSFIIKSESMSSITTTTHSQQYRLIQDLKVIIIDEASIIFNILIYCLYRTKQKTCNDKRAFIIKFVKFGGHFRTILIVIQRGSSSNIVLSCIKTNPMLPRICLITLSKNMRLNFQAKELSTYLFKIGEGECRQVSDANRWIIAFWEDIIDPYDPNIVNELRLIIFIFFDRLIVQTVEAYFKLVNLSPNKQNVINTRYRIISNILEGDMHSYFSVEELEIEESFDMQIESIHQLLPSAYPPHELKLNLKPKLLCFDTY